MKKLIPLLIVFLFSCTPKPEVPDSLRASYEECKTKLVTNKATFINLGETEAKRDSLRNYIADLENNSLDQLLEKYDVTEEEVPTFVYSVCEKSTRLELYLFEQDAKGLQL
jgi:hypothetical protein